jgi:hypothetical protein
MLSWKLKAAKSSNSGRAVYCGIFKEVSHDLAFAFAVGFSLGDNLMLSLGQHPEFLHLLIDENPSLASA